MLISNRSWFTNWSEGRTYGYWSKAGCSAKEESRSSGSAWPFSLTLSGGAVLWQFSTC